MLTKLNIYEIYLRSLDSIFIKLLEDLENLYLPQLLAICFKVNNLNNYL